jgi:hypothetical protein
MRYAPRLKVNYAGFACHRFKTVGLDKSIILL